MGRIKPSRVEKKREERTRGIRTKMNKINSRFIFVTTALVSTVTRKHRANAPKKNNYIIRVERRKGTNQQNPEDKRATES